MSQATAPTPDTRFYDFGPFRVDAVNRLLLRDRKIVPLTSKVFDILLIFVSNTGRLLDKEDLMKQVWPESFVEEGNLTRNVSTLRKALGESPQEHQYIITVPGRGYRFVPRVSEVRDESSALIIEEHSRAHIVIDEQEDEWPDSRGSTTVRAEPSTVATAKRAPASNRQRRVLVGALVGTSVLVVGLLAVYLLAVSKPARSPFLAGVSLISLTSTGDVYAPAISPNGKYLAYSSLEPGVYGLRIRQLATGSIVQLVPAGPAHYWAVTFSRDSDYVYYIIGDDGTNSGVLYRVPSVGGHAQQVLQHVNGQLTMSPDGRRLAFKRFGAKPASTAMVVADVDGNNEHTVASIDPSWDYQACDWSPDNKSIACAVRSVKPEGQSWYVAEIPIDGGSEKPIVTPRKTPIGEIAWLPDHSGLIMNAIEPETHVAQLSFIAYPGGEERQITHDLNNYKAISVTADGRTIVAEKMDSLSQLWIAPNGDTSRGRLLATAAGIAFHGLSWTPDNDVVFDAEENGKFDIWKMSADGSGRERLTDQQGRNLAPSLTPDGRRIVFISTRSGGPQIWRMDVDGNNPKQLTSASTPILDPQCAPDGKWAFYTSYVRGQWKLWKVSLDGGEASEVVDTPVEYWGISPDGRLLAYSFRDRELGRTRVAVVPLAGGAPLTYFDFEPDRAMHWTRDSRNLEFVRPDNQNVWLQPIAGGPPKKQTNLQPDLKLIQFTWSADGKRLAYTRGTDTYDAVALQIK